MARTKVRSNDLPAAAELYQKLYGLKPAIEEATWEYSKVLLQLKKFGTVQQLVKWLLEQNQDRIEYLLAAGQIAEYLNDFGAAQQHFSRAYELDPIGENSSKALRGLVTALRKQGLKDIAFPLEELLRIRFPNDENILKNLAIDARDLGRKRQAQKLYLELITRFRPDDRTLFQAAELFDEPELQEVCNRLRLQYLDRNPEYLPYRVGLVQYYEGRKEYNKALEQLFYLIEHAKDNQEYIIQAAELYEEKLHRPDKALLLYDKYAAQHPDLQDVSPKISRIQKSMAREFMILVENEGANLLWKDLAEIAPNRLAIFYEMADQFEAKSKTKELLEVLNIIRENTGFDHDIFMRILKALGTLGAVDEAKSLLASLDRAQRTADMYAELSRIGAKWGDDLVELSGYEGVLLFAPDNIGVRKSAICLAGSLGLADRLEVLWSGNDLAAAQSSELLLCYLKALVDTSQFDRFAEVLAANLPKFASDDEVVLQLKYLQFKKLIKQSLIFEGEQLLRKMLSAEEGGDDVIFHLVELALQEHDSAKAATWLQLLPPEHFDRQNDPLVQKKNLRRVFLEIEKDQLEKHYGKALNRLAKINTIPASVTGSTDQDEILDDLSAKRCELLNLLGKKDEAEKCIAARKKVFPGSTDTLVLEMTLHEVPPGSTLPEKAGKDQDLVENLNKMSLRSKLALVRKLQQNRATEQARRYLDDVLAQLPRSVVANQLLLDLLLEQGKMAEAEEVTATIRKMLPKETYFARQEVFIALKKADYLKALSLFNAVLGADSAKAAIATMQERHDFRGLLSYARILWGCKNQAEALAAYRQMLTPPVLLTMDKEFTVARINYLSINRENSLWSSLLQLLQTEPDLLENLMAPQFIVENRGQKASMIVADHYAAYSWQSQVADEYSGRKAIYDRNYYYAEQSYKELMESSKSAETMLDLAKVYSRIGKYRQEAKVYEEIRNQGVTSPELKSSIERSNLQTSPRSTLDFDYGRHEGRDGFIDMVRSGVGTRFWMTPDLEKDIQFGYAYNSYESTDGTRSTEGSSIVGGANFDIGQNSELTFNGGVEKLDGSNNNRFGYNFGYRGKLDRNVEGFITYRKEFVQDSVSALENNIAYREFAAGLNMETSLGLGFGGDLGHRNYNDDHDQNRFHSYVNYTVFGANIEWNARYDYRYLRNNEDNEGLEPDNTNDVDLSYWRPKKFADHEMSLEFKHNFLGYAEGDDRKMSYYAVKNIVGMEEKAPTYSALFDIFLEISPHLLLKGNFAVTTSSDYDERLLSVSVNYRW